MNKEEIENRIRDTVYDFLAEDERFYGKQDGTESITKVPERLIKELSTLIQESNEEAIKRYHAYITTSNGEFQEMSASDSARVLEEYLSSIGKEEE